MGNGVQHTNNDGAEINGSCSNYSDTFFTVIGTEIPHNILDGEFGLTALLGEHLSLYGKINTAFGDNYTSYGLNLGLNSTFRLSLNWKDKFNKQLHVIRVVSTSVKAGDKTA